MSTNIRSVVVGGCESVIGLPHSGYVVPPEDSSDRHSFSSSNTALTRELSRTRFWLSDNGNSAERSTRALGSQEFVESLTSAKLDQEEQKASVDVMQVTGLRRLRILLKVDPVNAGSLIAGMVGCIYLLLRVVVIAWPRLSSILLSVAYGQTNASKAVGSLPTGRDNFDWLIASFMGLVLLAAMGAALFCKEKNKVTFGMDTTKTIVGFLIGFLSGGRGRA